MDIYMNDKAVEEMSMIVHYSRRAQHGAAYSGEAAERHSSPALQNRHSSQSGFQDHCARRCQALPQRRHCQMRKFSTCKNGISLVL